MYTHCPHCDTCFRVASEQLKAARGSVRCGRCFGTFNALEHLVDEPPQPQTPPPALTAAATKKQPPASPLPATSKVAPTPAAPTAAVTLVQPTTAIAMPAPRLKPVPQPVPIPVPEPELKQTPAPTPAQTPIPVLHSSAATHPAAEAAAASTPPPQLLHEAQIEQLVEASQPTAHNPTHKRLWLWTFLTLLLALLFAIQYAWFNLTTLAQQSSLRPALQTMCSLLDCEVPLIKAPYMITLVERNIRNHPKRPDVLQVQARIISKTIDPQAYPLMELSLHDITGHVLATRRFTPDEYLDKGVDQKLGMTPQQPVDILLELDDPGKEAVGFEFAFH